MEKHLLPIIWKESQREDLPGNCVNSSYVMTDLPVEERRDVG